MTKPLLEGCVDSFASALTAAQNGADRLELCGNLSIGGTTPSPTLFEQVKRSCGVKTNVLIRPRFGDFLYDEYELEEMCGEITAFRKLGADGVVIGVLTPWGELDEKRLDRLIACAEGMELTLHRAFDMTKDPFAALETAVRLGFTTILTSGQAASALKGQALLQELQLRAAGRISIMAGGGVNSKNLTELHKSTGITAFHTSGRKGPVQSGMTYRKEGVSMGLPSLSEYELWRMDAEEFGACAAIVHDF